MTVFVKMRMHGSIAVRQRLCTLVSVYIQTGVLLAISADRGSMTVRVHLDQLRVDQKCILVYVWNKPLVVGLCVWRMSMFVYVFE